MPAGIFDGSAALSPLAGAPPALPPIPPLGESIPPDVPPLEDLVPVTAPFLCRDGAGSIPRFCSAGEARGCAPEAPGAELPVRCEPVGVRWPSDACPPGFLAEGSQPKEADSPPPCVPDAADCGTDPYGDPSLKDGPDILFVDGTTGDDGNPGARKTPLRTIAEAMSRLDGTVRRIAVAGGTYEGPLSTALPVTLLGRCAQLVKVIGVGGAALTLSGGVAGEPSLVRGLDLEGDGIGLVVEEGRHASISHVVVREVVGQGIVARGAGTVLDVEDVVVADILSEPETLNGGAGVVCREGALLTLRDARVSRARGAGLVATGEDSALEASGLLVDDTLPRESDGQFGRGVEALHGARAALTDARFRGNRNAGISAAHGGTLVEATRVIVDGTRADAASGAGGHGMYIAAGAHASITGSRLSANRSTGLLVEDEGTKVEATALLVDGTLPRDSDSLNGAGIAVSAGARLSLVGARLSGNRDMGLYVQNPGTTVNATELLIDGTLPRESDELRGSGAVVVDGAQLSMRSARLSGNRTSGLHALGEGTSVDVDGLLIDGTRSEAATQLAGAGVRAASGARVALKGARVSGSHDAGILLTDPGTSLEAAGLLVDGTLPVEADSTWGTGISAEGDTRLTLSDTRLSGNRFAGLLAWDAGTVIRAERMVVDGSLPEEATGSYGWGVAIFDGVVASFRDLRVSGNRGVGLYVLEDVPNGRVTRLDASGVLVDGTLDSDTAMGVGLGSVGASLRLYGGRIVESTLAGFYAMDSTVDMVGTRIESTLPSSTTQSGGTGIWLTYATEATIRQTRLVGQSAVGLAVSDAALDASGLIVVSTGWGQYPEVDDAGDLLGSTASLADGVMINASPATRVEHAFIASSGRAGVLVQGSAGALLSNTVIDASGSLYGLVVQKTATPVEASCAVFGASLQDRISDAGLSLPAPPPLAQPLAPP